MGFYVRKSVKAGPFRFNVSRSGLGVSAGVPGFRVGSGPRGNYASIGRDGFYYRTSVNPRAHVSHPVSSQGLQPSQDVVLEDVTGATAMVLVPSGPGDLVDQLNIAAKRARWALWIGLTVFALGIAAMPWGVVVWLIGLPLWWWAHQNDLHRRSVVMLYDVRDDAAAWFDRLVAAWASLEQANRLWRITASGDTVTVTQRKMHAGAASLVKRTQASANLKGCATLKTNVMVPTINAGDSSLYFLPDRVLVRDGRRFSDVAYGHLMSAGATKPFIEDANARLPKDSQRVGHTWQYVNVQGGPDRRYRQNPVLPIMAYGHLDFTSSNGLDWRVLTSNPEAWHAVVSILNEPTTPAPLAAPLPTTPRPDPREVVESHDSTHDSRMHLSTPDHAPTADATSPLEPWAKPWRQVEIAGIAHRKQAILHAFDQANILGRENQTEIDVDTHLYLDPNNPHDPDAVAVFAYGIHIGYLPRIEVRPIINDLRLLQQRGQHLTAPCRLRLYRHDSYPPSQAANDCFLNGYLSLPPAGGILPINQLPDQPYALLPRGRAIQVTEEEQHADALKRVTTDGTVYAATTLHVIERQKTHRSQPQTLVEVHINGEPIGVLTKSMSLQVVDLVAYVAEHHLIPVARAKVVGSPLRAEVTLDLARSAEVTSEWMSSIPALGKHHR